MNSFAALLQSIR